jgi:hypothetical protein
VQDFLRTTLPMQQFLTPISAVEDVSIQPTIPMFARLNALHIVYEASPCPINPSQPSQLSQPSHPSNPSNQSKKRVIIHHHHHARTRRMQHC